MRSGKKEWKWVVDIGSGMGGRGWNGNWNGKGMGNVRWQIVGS